jgi:putative membrane protein
MIPGMVARAVLSGLHVLTLALGLGAVFARGRRLRDLRDAPEDERALRRLYQADSLWGVAALLWIATGLGRVFGRLEKEPDFYLRNGFFWVKMGLFALILALEIRPMVTLLRWRAAKSRAGLLVREANLTPLIALNNAEIGVVLLIPFVAALMARGAWLF